MSIEQAYQLKDYIISLKEIENNHQKQKQSKIKQLERITDVIIWTLTAIVIYVATVQVLGV